ncbi:MAG: TM0106 family RecB-like putative nuclease [Gemmatimonadetes bacterium]|nr:TM0106 family RecB-like putative nuclease [Gemmatimonadota bacterium]
MADLGRRLPRARPAGAEYSEPVQRVDGRLLCSATDLVGHLECKHLTELEQSAALGLRKRPERDDPVLDRIAKRGTEHEMRFLEALRAEGITVTSIVADEGLSYPDRLAKGRDETRSAMAAGDELIYQAVLFDGRRLGYADFLRRVAQPSSLGEWGYEVWDAKLARHATAAAVLQLCMYSQMVEEIQGRPPEEMHLALGGVAREKVSFRFADFAAYYRLADRSLQSFLASCDGPELLTKPEPVEHCGVCRWRGECHRRWRDEDDLALVANLTSRQRRALSAIDVTTRKGLAQLEDPTAAAERLDGVSSKALSNIQAQAAIQVEGERAGRTISERIEPQLDRDGNLVPNHSLLMLPDPSPGDLFFDIEGDPFYGSDEVDGIDYLFGVVEPGASSGDDPAFYAFWSIDQERNTVTPAGEKRAFEQFIDFAMERLEADPDLHIYHYAPYEPTAVKRLAGRHGTREEEVDRLLRGEVFVDLYRAVRQGIRASVEGYSIKQLEPLYGFSREIELRDAGSSIVEFETWLELGEGEAGQDLLDSIKGYNRDDCLSTLHLRAWLESQRAELAEEYGDLPRPSVPEPEETEDSEEQQEVNQLAADLCDGLPEAVEEMDEPQHGRWLLAQLLNWHRREDKSFWWRYFQLANELTDQEHIQESDAIGGLTFVGSTPNPAPKAQSKLHRFSFPSQEHAIKVDSSPHDPATQGAVGTVHSIDEQAGEIVIKRGNAKPAPSARSLIPFDLVNPKPKPQSLQRIARWVLDHGIEGDGPHRAARDLLARQPPRLGQPQGQPLCQSEEDVQQAALRLTARLDRSYLAIQGPPGSGKSTVGAAMIVDLAAEGKRVGVTANSHKVIGELLLKVAKNAASRGIDVAIGQRIDRKRQPASSDFTHLKSNAEALEALVDGSVDVVGATTWLWASEDKAGSVDVLVIDEAGQMSLADAIAASPCAESLILLGDPQQLDQPLKGVHPPGSERSVLAHLLHRSRVMPDHLGLFLDRTWRLHPTICEYTSEVFYEGRLQPHPGRDKLNLAGTAPLDGTGLRHVAAAHHGRSNQSPEEVDQVTDLIDDLLGAQPAFTDADGNTRTVDQSDVLVVAPYNAQVGALIDALLPQSRVGTVDKFQGQEAPVSIYSMATSSADEAPRGMEFLYSLNRLNVATSRAQCLAVLVANPDLINARCRTPRQMQLANALARFMEMAALPTVG